MKEAVVSPDGGVEIKEVAIPKPNEDQVLIKVIFSGSNPKDWKVPTWTNKSSNTGDDIAGVVEAVGENVTEFKKGDRVAAFHEIMTDHGSFAEYAIAWAASTFHLPKKTSFEEGASIPLAAMTAAVGLYLRLDLPEPWKAARGPIPLIVYGGSSAVGAYAIKLAQLSNIHPIIAVAGRGKDFVETLIDRSKGDTIIDYRKGDEAVISGIQDIIKSSSLAEVKYAFDAVSEKGSYRNISKVLSKNGKFTFVIPSQDLSDFPDSVERGYTSVGSVHKPEDPESDRAKLGLKFGHRQFGYLFFRFFSRGLEEGWFSGHPTETIPGGLNGVAKGLGNLKAGVNSGTKYVFKIEDTK